jgi:hypothetical protein
MNKHLKTFLPVAICAILLNGCVTEQAPPPQTTQISCRIPKIDVIADAVNKETQSKGGLDITVVPALYKGIRVDKTITQHVEPTIGESIEMGVMGNLQNKIFVEEVTTPQLSADPSRLEFTVKIHNQLNRVFHGQGAVVQFNVDGKLIPFNNTDYKEFSGGIVPPLNDGDLKIIGPPLDLLKDKGTISVFLYDVITATDTAGNTTEKQNYTWDFSYTMQDVTDAGVMKKTRHLIDIGEYQQIMMRQQAQQMQQLQKAPDNSAQ